MCLATAYLCDDAESTCIPSDVVDAFVPAWMHIPHDIELINEVVSFVKVPKNKCSTI